VKSCVCGHTRINHSGLSLTSEPCRLCGCLNFREGPDLEDLIVQGPGARSSDPWTSKEAGEAQTPRKNGPLHAAILLALWAEPEPMANEDLWDLLGGPQSSITTRVHELRTAGLVEEAGSKDSKYGRKTLVWRLSDVGVDFVRGDVAALITLAERRRKRSA
jgi:hypothetical protein